jgi:hypothetical protein
MKGDKRRAIKKQEPAELEIENRSPKTGYPSLKTGPAPKVPAPRTPSHKMAQFCFYAFV